MVRVKKKGEGENGKRGKTKCSKRCLWWKMEGGGKEKA